MRLQSDPMPVYSPGKCERMSPSFLRLMVLGVCLLELQPVPVFAFQEPPAVPFRVLQTELTQMDQGTPAYIHTPYAIGIGYLLPSGQEIVTARHNIVKPSGDLEMNVGVGVPQPPLDNIVESTATPVAQDPARDLVLLRLTHELPARKTPALPVAPAGSPVTPLPTSVTPAATTTSEAGRAPNRRSAVRSARLHRQRTAHRLDLLMHGRPATAKNGPALRVVWDGPIPKRAAAPVTAAVVRKPGLHVVQDGPLH